MEGKEARSIAQVESEIADVKRQIEEARGSETEVYARIVGYYRAVRNWNRGKREEYGHRKMFSIDGAPAHASAAECCEAVRVARPSADAAAPVSYEMFVRASCPNCPPVKSYMAGSPLHGRAIDVDSEEGFSEAAAKGVFAAPTVIFYDAQNNEAARCHSVEEISSVLEPALAIA